jgi:oligoendopeptidase F
MSEGSQLPKWDLTNVYPGLDSVEFEQAKQGLAAQIKALEKYLRGNGIDPSAPAKEWAPDDLAQVVAGFLERIAAAQELAGTIRAYLISFISTDSYNEGAKKIFSILEPLIVRLVIRLGLMAK